MAVLKCYSIVNRNLTLLFYSHSSQEIRPAPGSTFFVPVGPSALDEATERGLSTQTSALDAGVNNFAISAQGARLDIQADEVGITQR